ncbi:MAG: M14 metallopeptidase family protein [Acidobacteriota bacterium]
MLRSPSCVAAAVSLVLVAIAASAAAQTPDRLDRDAMLWGEVLPGEILHDGIPGATEPHDASVPRPEEIFGHSVGAWHLQPEALVRYLEVLARSSDRVTLEQIGRTHEQRPLVVATITSPRNHARLDEILRRQAEVSDPRRASANDLSDDLSDLPIVVYLAYGVHGNEASASNAAPVVAHHLAASRSTAIEALLEDVVVLLDPSLNPDGLGRFTTWVNAHRGVRPVADPQHREHREGWPNGRTNHYLFDLNRDWLLATQPESRARLEIFHRFRPHVVADFHEMGTNSTFFFQPGVPSRRNPLTPRRNEDLTRELAGFHARALDHIGSLYWSEEIFDDFYYGKGSTYPDVQGAIGILFEQASARGHRQESINGEVTLPFAIRNQVTVSFSTLEGAQALRSELFAFRRQALADAFATARDGTTAAWIVGDDGDPGRLADFVELLARHRIEVAALQGPVDIDGRRFEPGRAVAVATAQEQAGLVRTIFEQPTAFEDSTFYDVSAWTLPLAFGLPFAASADAVLGDPMSAETLRNAIGVFEPTPDAVAYALRWTAQGAPRALAALLQAGVSTRIALRPPTADLGMGTVIVPVASQALERRQLETLLSAVAARAGVTFAPLASGLTESGIDLGSPGMPPIAPPTPAVIVGAGMTTYTTGELWHALDALFGLETTLLPRSRLADSDLDRYSHLLFAGGRGAMRETEHDVVAGWVRRGGVLVTLGADAEWAARLGEEDAGAGTMEPTAEDAEEPERRPYSERERDAAQERVAGTILEVELDLSHPLAAGYPSSALPVFRRGRQVLAPPRDAYSVVAAYTEAPLLAGFAAPEALEELAGTPALVAEPLGDGLVVRFGDAPNFRGIWHATHRLLANVIFLGPHVEPGLRR